MVYKLNEIQAYIAVPELPYILSTYIYDNLYAENSVDSLVFCI